MQPAGPATDHATMAERVRTLEAELAALRQRHESALGQLEERQAELMADLQQAQRFQRSILPPPPRLPATEIEVLYQPAALVGGDLYDVSALDEQRVRIFVADATGHGLTASLATMFIKSEYEIIKRTVKGPAGALRVLNERITRTYRQLDMRFSAVCLNVDLRARTLTWSTAAHPGAILIRDGVATELDSGGPFMGLVPDVPFPEHRLELKRGDALFAFTDGITEAWNPAGEPFGDERLRQCLLDSIRGGWPARSTLLERLDEFLGPGRGPDDDVTLVGLRWLDEEAAPAPVDPGIPGLAIT